MAKQSIGEFLSTLRKANGYTQQEIADRLCVSNRTVSAWERGTVMPDILLLPAIAELYGVTTDEILGGERRQTAEVELSRKAETKLLKNKLARFTMQACILMGILVIGLIFFFVGLYLKLVIAFWSGWQWWLLLLFVGLAAFVIVAIVMVAIYKGAESAAADESEKSNIFILLLSRRFTACSYTVSVISAILTAVACALPFGASYRYERALFIGIFVLLTLVTFFVAFIIYRQALKNYGAEQFAASRKKILPTFKKVAIGGAIPTACAIILGLVFLWVRPQKTYVLFEANSSEEFTVQMETLEVGGATMTDEEVDYDYTPAGKYFLNLTELSKTAEPYEKIDCGNNITVEFMYTKSICNIYYVERRENGDDISFAHFERTVVLHATNDASYTVFIIPLMPPHPPFGDFQVYRNETLIKREDGYTAYVLNTEFDYAVPFRITAEITLALYGVALALLSAISQRRIKIKL